MAKQALTLKTNAKEYQKHLKKIHGGLPKTASNTVNTGAKVVQKEYKKELKKFIRRNKFTMGAPKILFSRPKSRGGDFRPIGDINAIMGVPSLKGKDHYLADQEKGKAKRGTMKTKGKVALPMDKAARTGGAHNKPVKAALRLQKGKIQTLRVGNKKLGTPNDGFNARGGAQRWAILQKGMRNSRQGWDLAKQFFFMGMNAGFGVFKKAGSRIKKTRGLEKSSVRIKATHKLEKATGKLTDKMMTVIFKRAAFKFMRGR